MICTALIGVLPSLAGEEEHDLYCCVSLEGIVLSVALIWAAPSCGLLNYMQGVTNRCRLSWLTNSALVCKLKLGGGGGCLRGLSQWVQLCTWRPNKLWRTNSVLNLYMSSVKSHIWLDEPGQFSTLLCTHAVSLQCSPPSPLPINLGKCQNIPSTAYNRPAFSTFTKVQQRRCTLSKSFYHCSKNKQTFLYTFFWFKWSIYSEPKFVNV